MLKKDTEKSNIKVLIPKYINETEKKEDNKTLIFEQILEIE